MKYTNIPVVNNQLPDILCPPPLFAHLHSPQTRTTTVTVLFFGRGGNVCFFVGRRFQVALQTVDWLAILSSKCHETNSIGSIVSSNSLVKLPIA